MEFFKIHNSVAVSQSTASDLKKTSFQWRRFLLDSGGMTWRARSASL